MPTARSGGRPGLSRSCRSATLGQVEPEWVDPSIGSQRVDSNPLQHEHLSHSGAHHGLPVADKAGALGGKDSFDHTGLENDKVHYYAAFVDLGGSYSGGRFVEARPFDPEQGRCGGPTALEPRPSPRPIDPREASALSRARSARLSAAPGENTLPAASSRPLWRGGASLLRPPRPHRSGTRGYLMVAQDGRPYAYGAQRAHSCPAPPSSSCASSRGRPLLAFGGGFDYLLVGTRNSSSAAPSTSTAATSRPGRPFAKGEGRPNRVINHAPCTTHQPRVLCEPPPVGGAPTPSGTTAGDLAPATDRLRLRFPSAARPAHLRGHDRRRGPELGESQRRG